MFDDLVSLNLLLVERNGVFLWCNAGLALGFFMVQPLWRNASNLNVSYDATICRLDNYSATSGAFGTPQLGNGRDTPSRLLAGIAIVRKTFRHCGEGIGHFFRHVGFIFAFGDVANG